MTSVTTNTGGTQQFNGCWVTITIPLPTSYTAPHPVDRHDHRRGWLVEDPLHHGWRRSSFSTDLTTWKVAIRGNPVHLVP